MRDSSGTDTESGSTVQTDVGEKQKRKDGLKCPTQRTTEHLPLRSLLKCHQRDAFKVCKRPSVTDDK
jgi:hypothetical protein